MFNRITPDIPHSSAFCNSHLISFSQLFGWRRLRQLVTFVPGLLALSLLLQQGQEVIYPDSSASFAGLVIEDARVLSVFFLSCSW